MWDVYWSVEGSRCWTPIGLKLDLTAGQITRIAELLKDIMPERIWAIGPIRADGIVRV